MSPSSCRTTTAPTKSTAPDRIDGRKIRSAKNFYREIGSSVTGPRGYSDVISTRSPIAYGADSGRARCSTRSETSFAMPEYRCTLSDVSSAA
jgi:hypothetical protein